LCTSELESLNLFSALSASDSLPNGIENGLLQFSIDAIVVNIDPNNTMR
ncbi:5037_t:CDS:1, partial [Entrophospora sp. SA101]